MDPPPRRQGGAARFNEEYSFAPLTEHGLLGRGAFATVRVAYPRDGGPSVAVKCISKDGVGSESATMREARIMSSLDHSSVCRLDGVFEDDRNMYLVLEHIDGHELFDEVRHDGLGDEHAAKDVMRQILEALAHCHERGVVHRDVKLENILLERPSVPGARRVAKLIDFGLAVREGSARLDEEPILGTEPYLAPEALTCHSWAPSVDCWSAGVVLYALLTGLLLPPAVARGRERLNLLSEPLRGASPEALELLAGLLEVDAERRLTAAQAADHPWVREACGWGSDSESEGEEHFFGLPSLERQHSCDSTASTADCSLSPRRKPAKAADSDDFSLSPCCARAADCSPSSRRGFTMANYLPPGSVAATTTARQ